MNYEIIKTDNYLIIVDNSLIEEGDWVYSEYDKSLKNLKDIDDDMININDDYYKIIAHLPLNNSPILEGVDLLPPLEEDFYLTYNFFYVQGFNKAKNKYRYTEENLRNAIEIAKSSVGVDNDGESVYSHLTADQIIKSIQKSNLPSAFECETKITNQRVEMYASDGGYYSKSHLVESPKKIKTAKGYMQWVGKYIY